MLNKFPLSVGSALKAEEFAGPASGIPGLDSRGRAALTQAHIPTRISQGLKGLVSCQGLLDSCPRQDVGQVFGRYAVYDFPVRRVVRFSHPGNVLWGDSKKSGHFGVGTVVENRFYSLKNGIANILHILKKMLAQCLQSAYHS